MDAGRGKRRATAAGLNGAAIVSTPADCFWTTITTSTISSAPLANAKAAGWVAGVQAASHGNRRRRDSMASGSAASGRGVFGVWS